VRKKGVGSNVRNMINKNRFDSLCVQETIMQDFADKDLRKFDPSNSYLWD
jgi:hypothetical protein